MQVTFLILSMAVVISQCCRRGYFQASNDTCLHLAQPTMKNKDAYCSYIGGDVFGRPLTKEMQDAVAKAMKKDAEEWMPVGTWVGMERSGRGDLGKPPEKTWKFYKDDETFDPDDYSLWSEKPSKGSDKECGAVGSYTEFKVIPLKCSNGLALLCEKDLSPCDRGLHSYVNYDGHCMVVVKDLKMYDAGKSSCKGGNLFPLKEESELEAVWQAFYNSKFSGGIYIGLDRADNGAWTYLNGETEEGVQSDNNPNDLKCGVVRLFQNLTLGLFGQSCESEHTWFMCERTTK